METLTGIGIAMGKEQEPIKQKISDSLDNKIRCGWENRINSIESESKKSSDSFIDSYDNINTNNNTAEGIIAFPTGY